MKKCIYYGVVMMSVMVMMSSCASNKAQQKNYGGSMSIEVTQANDLPEFKGEADKFSGTATIEMLYMPNEARKFSSANVTFEPGARTAWHTHPAGQTLVILEGEGWVQMEGQPRKVMRKGDVVWIPPTVKHWHGATDKSQMTHTAIQGEVEGQVVTWLELVSDEQYAE